MSEKFTPDPRIKKIAELHTMGVGDEQRLPDTALQCKEAYANDPQEKPLFFLQKVVQDVIGKLGYADKQRGARVNRRQNDHHTAPLVQESDTYADHAARTQYVAAKFLGISDVATLIATGLHDAYDPKLHDENGTTTQIIRDTLASHNIPQNIQERVIGILTVFNKEDEANARRAEATKNALLQRPQSPFGKTHTEQEYTAMVAYINKNLISSDRDETDTNATKTSLWPSTPHTLQWAVEKPGAVEASLVTLAAAIDHIRHAKKDQSQEERQQIALTILRRVYPILVADSIQYRQALALVLRAFFDQHYDRVVRAAREVSSWHTIPRKSGQEGTVHDNTKGGIPVHFDATIRASRLYIKDQIRSLITSKDPNLLPLKKSFAKAIGCSNIDMLRDPENDGVRFISAEVYMTRVEEYTAGQRKRILEPNEIAFVHRKKGIPSMLLKQMEKRTKYIEGQNKPIDEMTEQDWVQKMSIYGPDMLGIQCIMSDEIARVVTEYQVERITDARGNSTFQEREDPLIGFRFPEETEDKSVYPRPLNIGSSIERQNQPSVSIIVEEYGGGNSQGTQSPHSHVNVKHTDVNVKHTEYFLEIMNRLTVTIYGYSVPAIHTVAIIPPRGNNDKNHGKLSAVEVHFISEKYYKQYIAGDNPDNNTAYKIGKQIQAESLNANISSEEIAQLGMKIKQIIEGLQHANTSAQLFSGEEDQKQQTGTVFLQ